MAKPKDQEKTALGEELALVISNETTVKVLVILVERAASPKEIAARLGLTIPRVSHHVKKLERLHLIELIDEKEVGGAIQHTYRAIVRPIVSTEEWDKLGIEERQRYSIWIVRMILADAAVSFQTNLFDARSSNHLSRAPLFVDALGLDEISKTQGRALREFFDAEAASAQRIAQEGTVGFNIIAAMMCFELPGPSDGLNYPGEDEETGR